MLHRTVENDVATWCVTRPALRGLELTRLRSYEENHWWWDIVIHFRLFALPIVWVFAANGDQRITVCDSPM
jgi:hypothetical protein